MCFCIYSTVNGAIIISFFSSLKFFFVSVVTATSFCSLNVVSALLLYELHSSHSMSYILQYSSFYILLLLCEGLFVIVHPAVLCVRLDSNTMSLCQVTSLTISSQW
jgi:hypothetical protein